MTIQEALAKAIEILGDSAYVNMERTLRIDSDQTFRWIHHESLSSGCVYSCRSWEHALAMAASGNEDIWPEVSEEIEA